MCVGKEGGVRAEEALKKIKNLGHCLGVAAPYCLEGAECFCLLFDFSTLLGEHWFCVHKCITPPAHNKACA